MLHNQNTLTPIPDYLKINYRETVEKIGEIEWLRSYVKGPSVHPTSSPDLGLNL